MKECSTQVKEKTWMKKHGTQAKTPTHNIQRMPHKESTWMK